MNAATTATTATTVSGSSSSASSVERELRLVKEAAGRLGQTASQAERGAVSGIDFDRLFQTIADCTESLQQIAAGTVPQRDPQTNLVIPASGPVGFIPGRAAALEGASYGSNNNNNINGTSGGATGVYARPLYNTGSSTSSGAAAAAGGGAFFSGGGGGRSPAVVTELQKRRAQQTLSELRLTENSLRQAARRWRQSQSYAAQREELLGGGGSGGSGGGGGRGDDAFSEVQHLQREKESLLYARRRMQQMGAESEEVLQALLSQGARLGGIGNKVGDLLESLGLSDTTLMQIVRRNQVDAWLVYGGIALLLFFMWYMFW